MPDTKFTNPTLLIPPDDRRTVYVRIPTSDFNLLRIVRADAGTITTTVNILTKKLCDECRKRGIIDLTRADEFERLVQSVTFSDDSYISVSREEYDELKRLAAGGLRDSPATGSPQKTDGRDVTRRTSSKGRRDTKAKEGPNGVQTKD